MILHHAIRSAGAAIGCATAASPRPGECSDCGRPISSKRLAAVPRARRCIHCQRELEAEGA